MPDQAAGNEAVQNVANQRQRKEHKDGPKIGGMRIHGMI
jgi:hypothetical protein